MKKLLIIALALITLPALAQTKKEIKKEVKIENTDGKYNVTIVTTENGETKTVTKSYSSLEEMKKDPEMGDMKIMTISDSEQDIMFFNNESDVDDKEIKVIVKKMGDEEIHVDHDIDVDNESSFVFKSDGDSDMHKIKVWVDENGEKHISKDGVEIEGNTWTDDSGKSFDIKKTDGKITIISKDQTGEFITEDGEHINVEINVEGTEEGKHSEMIFIEKISSDDEIDGDQKIVIKITEELKIHLEEIEENEFIEAPGINAKALKINDFNYYPNPSSGRFTLAFEADKKPTEIRITGIDGKEVYGEIIQSFEGNYNKEIDLSAQRPGIYLLQILQGKKAMNKKIVIE